jgi:hypothetical protein
MSVVGRRYFNPYTQVHLQDDPGEPLLLTVTIITELDMTFEDAQRACEEKRDNLTKLIKNYLEVQKGK